MKVLIAGCGYIGRALGAELVRRHHLVSGLRRSHDGELELRSVGIVPLFGDITRPETLDTLPRDFDWVINSVSASGGGAEDYRRVYVEGNQALVEWLKDSPVQKFVYTSSTGVYGQNDGSQVDETSVTLPEAETGKALVAAERVLLEAAQAGFPAVILRLAGIYGPGRGYWLKQFLAGKARLEGSGGRILNMVHRDDIVGAIIAALQCGSPGGVYNVVDDLPATQIEVFEWLAAKLGRELPSRAADVVAAKTRRAATNKRVSNHRLRTDLAYDLHYPTFREGFAAELKLQTGRALR